MSVAHQQLQLLQAVDDRRQAMFDDGTNGDMTPGDNVYSVSAPITAADGSYNLTATIRDAQARSATAVIQLGVGDSIFGHGFED